MGLSVTNQKSDPALNAVSLVVEQNGSAVLVRAGAFTIAGVVFNLSQDQVYTHVADPSKMSVSGCLSRYRSTGVVQLFVDEVKDDGADTHYRFLATDPYELLHRLFHVEIPPNTTSLNDHEVKIMRIVAPV